jgi:hypothetical protein
MTRVKGSGLLNYTLNWGGYLKRLLHGEDLSKVKHCTNGDAVKRLANAFDKCANVDFGRLTEQFGKGHRCLSQQ